MCFNVNAVARWRHGLVRGEARVNTRGSTVALQMFAGALCRNAGRPSEGVPARRIGRASHVVEKRSSHQRGVLSVTGRDPHAGANFTLNRTVA
jgi:hypothetical protein